MANLESSLKLRPAEREDIKDEQVRSLNPLPTEILSMEAVTGEEDCSLKMCPTKRKAPTAGHLPSLKGGAIKRKGDDGCPEGVDKFAKDATVLVTTDEIEEQAISDTKVAAATQKVAPGTGFSELGKHVDGKLESDKTMGEEEKAFPETKDTAPDDTVEEEEDDDDTGHYYTTDEELKWSEDESDDDDVEFQVVVDRVTAKYNRYMQKLLARDTSVVFTDITFDSEGEAVYAL